MQTNNIVGPNAADTLYYDGRCPVCSAEIHRLQSQLNSRLDCINIHETTATPIAREQLFEQLHLLTADGTWLVGLEANVAAWQHTRWRLLAGTLLWPGVRQIAELCYRLWLRWYQKQRASN